MSSEIPSQCQLERMVNDSVEKEKKLWKPLELSENLSRPGAGVTYDHRADVLEWLSLVAQKFQFYPEAQSMAVSILDRFLTCVKMQTKYLKCVALSCLYIACKITEEDEIVPHISDFVTQSSANCSTDDIVRMERLILNKLDWNVYMSTPLHFLQVCHALLLMQHPDLLSTVPHVTPGLQLGLLTHKLQLCVTSSDYPQWSPSIIGVSLLSLELEQFRPDWFPLTLFLLKAVKKEDFSELIGCRESLSSHLALLVKQAQAEIAEQAAQTESCRQHKRTRHHTNGRSKRKMMEPPLDQDDIYTSIKGLYSEEGIGEHPAATLDNED